MYEALWITCTIITKTRSNQPPLIHGSVSLRLNTPAKVIKDTNRKKWNMKKLTRLETLIDKWGKRSCHIIDKNTFIVLEFLNWIKQMKKKSLTHWSSHKWWHNEHNKPTKLSIEKFQWKKETKSIIYNFNCAALKLYSKTIANNLLGTLHKTSKTYNEKNKYIHYFRLAAHKLLTNQMGKAKQ